MVRHEDYDQHDVIIVEDETLRAGFTQIPNAILRRPDVTPGAKLAYMALLSYAWQQGSCFPGQETLAADMGVSKRSVVTYLQQLQEGGLLVVRRRGLGRTNIYALPRIMASPQLDNARGRSAKFALQEVQKTPHQEVQILHIEEDSVKENSGEKDEDFISNYGLTHPNVDNSPRPVPTHDAHRPIGGSRPPTHAPTNGHRPDIERNEGGPARQAIARPTSPREHRGTGMNSVRDVLQQRPADPVLEDPSVPRERPTAARSTSGGRGMAPHIETARETRPERSASDTRTTPSSRRGQPPKAPPYIAAVMEDVSFKLHDEHPHSSLTRVMRLLGASGLEEWTFVEVLYRARSIARQQGNVNRRMPYWFSVLEDLLGLKDDAGAPVAEHGGGTSP